ncbi:ABC transporter substrate-binding protein [Candidatus Sumerlaeota bacterium]|nr:ABC transporter substrate-binding protein [Candidatus Sumerlaeota bacterium]
MTEIRHLTLGHSPDPDDAFMHWALAVERIDTGHLRYEHILQDIQTLNERATRGELDITAISVHAYAFVLDKYLILPHGASMGEPTYGPMVVAREPMEPGKLREVRLAIPGEMTSAHLALQLAIGRYDFTVIPFDQIIAAVRDGEVDAGLLIHEGQLTYQNEGLVSVIELGPWWAEQTGGLPLPLGANTVHRRLGDLIPTVSGHLRTSIQMALEHREEAVAHALQCARGMGHDLADRFVGMYVNERTLDYGEEGRAAVRELLSRAHRAGLIPEPVELEFVE